jgi:hypothetical protein
MTDGRGRPPLWSVALVSSAALATEILLTRLFALVHWYHFAYMIIGLALLGFGASGAFLAIAQRRLLARFRAAYLANVAGFGVLVVLCPILARDLPFQAEQLLWDPWQPAWLALLFLVLSLPFFCAANAIGLALSAFRDRVGRVYSADLVGAGLGAVGVLGLLYLLWPEDILRIVAGSGLAAVWVGAVELRVRSRLLPWLLVAGLAALVGLPRESLRLEPGPYKDLSQALEVAGTRVLLERSSPLGRITVIESPDVPLRHVPGLSLNSTSEPPVQLGVFTDGEAMRAITAASDDPGRLAFLSETTSALAYRVARPRSVLVPEAGGGAEILSALAAGAAEIDALELDPGIAQLLTSDFRAFTGGLVGQPGVALHVAEARGFLAGTDRRYDLIQLTPAGGTGGGLGGMGEDYTHTVEAFGLYLDHLGPGGFLSLTHRVQIPPRDGLKGLATVVAALESDGVEDPGSRIVMIRGWQTSTLLVRNGAVTAAGIDRLRDFCSELSFDLVWYPGMSRSEANLYNQLPGPWFHDAVQQLLGPERAAFIAGYDFDIRPATDARPYFANFFRWRTLSEALSARERGGMALLEGGYLLLVATLLVAVAAGAVLILLPLGVFVPLRGVPRGRRWQVFAYFTAIGLAFLFVEIVFLHKLTLLVHHPTVALALVLATFLLAAGAGSAWAGRTDTGRSRRTLAGAVAAILLLGAAYALGFDALVPAMSSWPVPLRAAAAAALLGPLAFCMGMPFPLAVRGLEEPLVPWAWGINGCASVASAVIATLLAVELGFEAVLWIALALYALVPAVHPAFRATAIRP